MNLKKVFIISLIVVAIFASVSFISAKDIEDIGFNVSSELEPTDGDGLQFEDADGNYFRIFENAVEDVNASKYYVKYNETVFMFNTTMGGNSITDADGNEIGKMPVTTYFGYGEYIKIDGKTYCVDISAGNMQNPDYEKVLEYFNYFNEHNSFESVKLY